MRNSEENPNRFYTTWGSKAFLHVDNEHDIGQIKFFAGTLGKGARGKRSAEHTSYAYVPKHKLLAALMPVLCSPEWAEEMNHTWYGGAEYDDGIQARILSITTNHKMTKPYLVTVASGPGKKTKDGGFSPAGDMDSTTLFFDLPSFLEFAAACYLAIMNQVGVAHESYHEDLDDYDPEEEGNEDPGRDEDEDEEGDGPADDEEEWEDDDEEDEEWGDDDEDDDDEDDDEHPQGDISEELIDELEKAATNSGWTEEAIERWFEEAGVETWEDLSPEQIEAAQKDFNSTSVACFFNVQGLTPAQRKKEPGDTSRKKFHALAGELAKKLKLDKDEFKDSAIYYVTNKRTNSYKDLCLYEVRCMIRMMEIEIEKQK